MSAFPDQEKIAGAPEVTDAHEFEASEALKAVKAGHADEVDIAAQVLANNLASMGSETWTLEEDKKLIHKVDCRLIPIVRLFPPLPDARVELPPSFSFALLCLDSIRQLSQRQQYTT